MIKPASNNISIVSILLFVGFEAMAQTPSFIRFGAQRGFSSDLVYSAFQDSKDILWFGTDQGLVYYDNNKFRQYTTENGLPDPEVLNIWEDSRENLWITCFRQKPNYRRNGMFITDKEDVSLRNAEMYLGICNYYEDENHKVWLLGSIADIYRLDDTSSQKYTFPDAILYLKVINSKRYALATTSLFDFSSDDPVCIYKFDKETLVSDGTEGVENIGNRILYSFKDRIVLLEIINNRVRRLDTKLNLSGRVYADRTNRFWVCSPSLGAICFDNNKRDLSNPKVYLPGKKTTSMIEDVQGTYWFCTLDDGVYGLPLGAPVTYSKTDGIRSNNLVSVARDSSGRILFGDDEGNMNILSNGTLSVERYHSTDGYNRVLGIYPIAKNEIWVVTDEGVYVQQSNGVRKKVPAVGSPKTLYPDGDRIWCGTSAGLFEIDRKTGGLHRHSTQRITAIAKDSEGVIWTGRIEGLLNNADSFRYNWGNRFPELQSRIVAIRNGGPNRLWVITPNLGLLRVIVRKGRVEQVEPINKFLTQPIHNIHSLFQDASGLLWLSTNRGIFRLNPQDWSVLRYNHHDGLPNNDIKSIIVHGDTLWTVSPGGLTCVSLKPIPQKTKFPTYITAVRFRQNDEMREIFLNDAPLQIRTTILPLEATLVEVDFAGLDYRSRGNLLFDCVLEEELPPTQWITSDNLVQWLKTRFWGDTPDTIRLTKSSLDFGVNMPPGKYKLTVTALTQNNVYGRTSEAWTVIMPARWYATIWFTLAIWIFTGLAIVRIFQIRDQLRVMALTVGRFRLMALQAQINPHFIGNAINAIQRFFYPPNPTISSIYTATFTTMLRKTLDYSEKVFITFEEEVAFCKHYLEMARLRYSDAKFVYTISGVESIPADMPYPSLFLQPILENATIHGIAPSGKTMIHIEYTILKGRLICTITDNGPGLKKEKGKEGDRADFKRRSKGISILKNKASTLNQLFDLDLHLEIRDRSDLWHNERGTRAVVSFDVRKIQKAPQKQAKIERYAVPSGH